MYWTQPENRGLMCPLGFVLPVCTLLHTFCTPEWLDNRCKWLHCMQTMQRINKDKMTMINQMWRFCANFKIDEWCALDSFNQRARDSSSLERTKIQRGIARFLVGFSFFWMLAHLCTLFAHRRESRVFPCPDKLSEICNKGYHGLWRASRWFCKVYCRNAVIVGLVYGICYLDRHCFEKLR